MNKVMMISPRDFVNRMSIYRVSQNSTDKIGGVAE